MGLCSGLVGCPIIACLQKLLCKYIDTFHCQTVLSATGEEPTMGAVHAWETPSQVLGR